MKTIKHILSVLILLVVGMSYGQTQQKIDMTLDALGNSKLNIAMTMNAQQWQMWLQSVGNNPAALKREVQRSMPAYFLDDFKLEKNDMERSFVLSLNAYGACTVDRRGNWILNTEQKNANLTQLTDHKYILVSSPPEAGGAIQQTFTLQFPEEAQDIKIDKDAYGKTIFRFKMKNSTAGFNLMLGAGVLLILLGGAWFMKNIVRK